ncbi:hypothetical protein [Thermoactinospora rubra]|uniref:hypothetical protein n=1 Tax=Thermoactinospora rubra TaxID=1088767 RepID=UPI00117F088F|nr:hypothetical protein [Thermoactinospora rubra]
MNDLEAVRAALKAPPPAPEVKRAGRARLAAAALADPPDRHPVRRSRRAARWSTLAIGLAGAAAAVALAFSSVHAPPDAQRILLAAATEVARTPDQGAWWGTTVIHGRQFHDPARRYVLRQTESEEVWIPADPEAPTWYRLTYLGTAPATPEDEAAWRADGSPASWTFPAGALPRSMWRFPDAVQAAPRGPATWSSEDWDLRVVIAGKPLTRMSEVSLDAVRGGDRAAVDSLARLLVFAPVASETRAEAYRLLARMPGVTPVGEVTDPLGRTGQAVEYSSAEYGGRVRLVIDPGTGAPLAIEKRGTSGDGPQPVEFTAVRQGRWADDNPLKEKP